MLLTFISRLLLASIIFSALLLGGCEKEPDIIPTLRLAYAPHDHHSPVYIAARNPEYFKENGGVFLEEITPKEEYFLVADNKRIAKLTFKSSTGGKEIIRKLSEGQVDFSLGGVPAILYFIDKGADISIVAPVMSEGAGLVIANDMPVNNWQEFVNFAAVSPTPLRIGYKIDVSVHNLIFEHAAREEHIPISRGTNSTKGQIRVINLHGAKNLISALENDLIDGFVVNQPFPALAETKGIGRTIAQLKDLPPSGRWKGHPCCAVVASNQYLQNHQDISVKLTTLLMRATEFIPTHPAPSQEQIAEWLGLPVEVEERSLPTILFNPRLTQDWQGGVDFWVQSMTGSGKLQGKIQQALNGNHLQDSIYNMSIYNQALESK